MKLHLIWYGIVLSSHFYHSGSILLQLFKRSNNSWSGTLEIKSWYASLKGILEILRIFDGLFEKFMGSILVFVCTLLFNFPETGIQIRTSIHLSVFEDISFLWGHLESVVTILPWTPTKFITNNCDFVFQCYYLCFICNSITSYWFAVFVANS